MLQLLLHPYSVLSVYSVFSFMYFVSLSCAYLLTLYHVLVVFVSFFTYTTLSWLIFVCYVVVILHNLWDHFVLYFRFVYWSVCIVFHFNFVVFWFSWIFRILVEFDASFCMPLHSLHAFAVTFLYLKIKQHHKGSRHCDVTITHVPTWGLETFARQGC